MSAGIGGNSSQPKTQKLSSLLSSGRPSNIYSFQNKPMNRYAKALPKPTKDNIEDICEIIRTNVVPHKKMQVLNALRESKFAYLGELSAIFHEIELKHQLEKEDLGQVATSLTTDRLSKFSQLAKQLLLLCDPQTIEALMSEKFYMFVFGALEMLPEFKDRLDCREFFRNSIFREVLPIKNERLISKIHLYYRVNFLKESIFPNQEG